MPSGRKDFETAHLGVFAAPGSPLAHVQLRNSGLARTGITATFSHARILGAKKRISDCRHKDCNDCYVRHRLFGVNLRAPMILAKLLLPAMIEKGEGVVINIGSVSAKNRRSQRRGLFRVKVWPDRLHPVALRRSARARHQGCGDPSEIRRHAADPTQPAA